MIVNYSSPDMQQEFIKEFNKKFNKFSKNIPLVISIMLTSTYVAINVLDLNLKEKFYFDFQEKPNENIFLISKWLERFYPRVVIDGESWIVKKSLLSSNTLILNKESNQRIFRQYSVTFPIVSVFKNFYKGESITNTFLKRSTLVREGNLDD